jgi:cellobiose-specific phosphotransferase system component IIA
MTRKKYLGIVFCLVFAGGWGASVPASAVEPGEGSKWDRAGQKVKEATLAVGEATEESTDQAVAEAMKAWEEAKRKYHESVAAAKKRYDEEVARAKAKIHAATAPDDGQDLTGGKERTPDEQREIEPAGN